MINEKQSLYYVKKIITTKYRFFRYVVNKLGLIKTILKMVPTKCYTWK